MINRISCVYSHTHQKLIYLVSDRILEPYTEPYSEPCSEPRIHLSSFLCSHLYQWHYLFSDLQLRNLSNLIYFYIQWIVEQPIQNHPGPESAPRAASSATTVAPPTLTKCTRTRTTTIYNIILVCPAAGTLLGEDPLHQAPPENVQA